MSSTRAPFVYVAGKFVNLLLAPIAIIILPGVLGEEGYGRYGYWFGLISIYIVLMDLGSQAVLRRFIPQLSQQHPKQVNTLFWICQKLKLAPLLLLLLALLFSGQTELSLALIIAALCAAISNNLADIFYAYQKMGYYSVAILSRRILRLLLVPLFFVIWELPGILAALVVSEVLGLLIASPALRQLEKKSEPLKQPFIRYYRHGFLVFIAVFISTLAGRVPVFSAEWAGLSLEEVGRIALCVDLTYFALKELINALTESIYPQLIKHFSAGKMASFNGLIGLNYRLINFSLLAIMAIGIPLAPGFLALLGEQFYLASTELQLLMFSLIFSCWNNIHGHIQLIHQRSRQILFSQFCGLTIHLLCITLLWQQLTIMSLAIALTLGTTVATTISYLDCRKLTQHTNNTTTFLKLLPVALITSTTLWYWDPRGLLPVATAIIIGGGVFILLANITQGLQRSDIQFLLNAMKGDKR